MTTLGERAKLPDMLGVFVLLAILMGTGLLVDNQFQLSVVLTIVIYAIAATGLTLLVGFAGQISLGQNAFIGTGAYCAAISVQSFSLHPLTGTIIAMVVPAVLAYAIARPILRLSGHYLALATLALGTAFYIVASQWHTVTGGLDPGIVDLPKFVIFRGLLPPKQLFFFASLCLLLVVSLSLVLIHSSIGRALRAIRVSEVVAAGAGIKVEHVKACIFALAAALAGLSGALFAFYFRSFNSGSFAIGQSIELLMMVIIGSRNTVWGAVLGTALIVTLPNLLEQFEFAKLLIYGLIMTAVVLFLPEGLTVGLVNAAKRTVALRRAG